VERVNCIDAFQAPDLPVGSRRFAFEVSLRNINVTHTDAEALKIVAGVIELLKKNDGWDVLI
jgi:phenylalanyl-tRNA synthetase beta subunit